LKVHGTQTLFSACRETKVRPCLVLSTADVYKASEEAHHESRHVGPFNIYGVTKDGRTIGSSGSGAAADCHFVIAEYLTCMVRTNESAHPSGSDRPDPRLQWQRRLRLGNVTRSAIWFPSSTPLASN